MSSVALVHVCHKDGPVVTTEVCINTHIANAWRDRYVALGYDGTYTSRESVTEHIPPKE